MINDDRESLGRIAYGRDATAEERAVAEAELLRLDEAERAGAADTRHASGEALMNREPSTEQDPNIVAAKDIDSPSLWRRSIRVAWLVPIVAGSIAIGYVASIGPLEAKNDTQNLTDVESPSPTTEPTEEPSPSALWGDLAGADSWFDRTYKETDAFPNAVALHQFGINPEDVRIVINGGDKGSVWVGKTEGTLCLLLADPIEGTSASSCTKRDMFAEDGVALGTKNLGASWYGREVTTTPLLVPVATTPPPKKSGPGDLTAANAWFALPALSSDEYPYADMLAGAHVDQGDIRRFIPESTPWIKLWLAKQSTGGFCFLSFDDADSSSGAACVPTEEFQKRGLTTSTQGYSFYWDGTTVSVTGQ